MKKINLKAIKREITGKKVKNLRNKGLIPAVIYGSSEKPENLSMDKIEFNKVYIDAGTSNLVDLTIDNEKPIKILLNEPQYDPVSDEPIHADLYRVNMAEKITTKIPLEFIGEAPAVKELEGNLITNKDEIEVECLPSNLISEINVDINALKTFDDLIYVKDLNIPDNITVLDEKDEIVAQVTPPRSEEELEAMETEAASDQEKEQIEKMESEADAEKGGEETDESTEKDGEKVTKETSPKEEEKK